MRWHPDKNNGSKESTARFKEIANAYSILSDPAQRAHYDQSRLQPSPGSASDDPEVDIERALYLFFARNVYPRVRAHIPEPVARDHTERTDLSGGARPILLRLLPSRLIGIARQPFAALHMHSFVCAVFWLIIGTVVTGVTYLIAPGGLYVITIGLFLFGGWNLLRALYYLLTGEAPAPRENWDD